MSDEKGPGMQRLRETNLACLKNQERILGGGARKGEVGEEGVGES